MAETRPIIVKKVKKVAGGHHGGAWKLAYADFVTAMMAFFLLMWLLSSSTEEELEDVSYYFKNPWKPVVVKTLKMPFTGGDGTLPPEEKKGFQGGFKNKGKGKGNEEKGGEGIEEGDAENLAEGNSDEAAEAAEAAKNSADVVNLQKIKEKLQHLMLMSEVLVEYKGQFGIDITTEGLRIQVVDADKRPMFDTGSMIMQAYAIEIMHEIAPIINQLPNRISITGHTDSRPYSSGGRGYSNWELSADRANAARRALVTGGIKEDKFLRIVGLADSVPLDPNNLLNPINRRISVIVMNRTTERQLIENSGPVIEIGKGAKPPPPGITPLFPALPQPLLPQPSSTSAPPTPLSAPSAPVPNARPAKRPEPR